MILKDLIKNIENKYPLDLAYSWDNVGLIVGDLDKKINKIMVSLEANENVIDEAINKNVDIIITHHPFIFSKMNKITTSDLKGKLLYKLIRNDIAVYSMHTNFDVSIDGLNDYFMEIMNFKNIEILDLNEKGCGLGRISNLDKELTLLELCKLVKDKFNVKKLNFCGDKNSKIKRVAVVTGSGSDMVKICIEKNVDVLITGDVKYHQAQDIVDLGFNLIDCGHFESEDIFKDCMSGFLKENFNIEIIKSEINLNPFNTL